MDSYDLQARHAPVVLAIAPLLLLAAIEMPEFQNSIALPVAFGAAFVAAIYALLARVARSLGRQKELVLFKDWGGLPTTAMLRHRDRRLNQHTKARYHERLNSMGFAFNLPSATEELANPIEADAKYESAIDEVRRRAKANRNAAVFRENVSYGFSRNLLALKQFGISISLLTLAILVSVLYWRYRFDAIVPGSVEIAFVFILIFDVLAWLVLVTPKLVRHQAEAYAVALFETIVKA